MKIKGLQKLTLLDYPEKMACTIFLEGCNLRCPFCQNGSLVLPEKMDGESISVKDLFVFLEKRRSVLDGVCVTGGEPLINNNINDFLSRIKELGYNIKLDTNGSYPEKLNTLITSGLIDYVAMDIKNSKESYSETVGIKNFDISSICESVELLKSDIIPYEFRTTVIKEFHEKRNFYDIGVWIKGTERYFIQNFVDSDDVICSGLHGFERDELQEIQVFLNELGVNTEIRGL